MVAASALLCAWLAGVASARSAAQGTLEICKSDANGAAGVPFSFTATKGTLAPVTVTVNGGKCSDPIPVNTGNWLIQEDLSSGLWNMVGTEVTPPGNWVSENDKAGKVKVAVTVGAETQVTIENAQSVASIKVCKWSSEPAFLNKEYSFTLLGTTVTAKAGPNKANAGCSSAVQVQPGAKFSVTEAVPADQAVQPVTTSSNLTVRSQVGGLVRVTAGVGANIIWFDNEPVAPPQDGTLEVCKDAGDEFIPPNKGVKFTITDSKGFSDTESVIPGQCSGPITVASGNVNVAEDIPNGEFVSDIFLGVNSAGALGPNNPTNGTATVVVPVASAGDVQLHFENSTFVTTLKICKYLTATSGQLDGQTFVFHVNDDAGYQQVRIVANTSVNGACKNVTYENGAPVVVPVGSTVTVVEGSMPYVGVNGGAAGAGGTVVITAGPSINVISFTNQAYGQIEICKLIAAVAGDPTYWVTFNFSVDGSKTTTPVNAGRCSPPQIIAAGSHTITEVNIPYGFQFVSAAATGPTGDPRGTGGNPITISVPWFGADPPNGGETLVAFTNKVQRAQIKICKAIEAGSETPLGGLNYSFTGAVSGTVYPPYPNGANACTGLLPAGGIPIVDANGKPITLSVTETHNGPFVVTNASSVSGGTGASVSGYTITWTPGPGPNIVTFVNRYSAPTG